MPERPALAPKVHLAGEMQGTGFQDRQWLVERDGRFLQVAELLYRVLEQADGVRTLEEIAAGVTASTDWLVSADQVRHVMQTTLIPRGLIVPVVPAAGAAASPVPIHDPAQARSSLAVRARLKFLGPRMLDPITRFLQVLYAPPVLIPLLIAIAIAHWWLYAVHGLTDSVRAALFTPGALLVVLAMMPVAAFFHEFGHAAALRYGGGQVRGIGAGLYLVWPVFYTDVTDSYRLGRWARVRTDLGGFYFHLIFALGVGAFALLSGHEFLLLAIPLINLEIIRQCLPFVRFDGYWALADLTGVPDFFSQMVPFLRSFLPAHLVKRGKLPPLKPWAKAVFGAYLAATIPVLALLSFLIVKGVPYLVTVAWDALHAQSAVFAGALRAGDALVMAASATQMLLIALQVLATALVLYGIGRPLVRGIWTLSAPTAPRRLAGALISTGAVALLVFLWAPQLQQLPFVRGTVVAGVQSFDVTERDHVETPVSYAQTPPVGGHHAPVWQNCGYYAAPVASEHAVHSLEHGAVWITYRPDLPEAQVDVLRRLARTQTYVLVSPVPDLPAPVVASAWGRQLRLGGVEDAALGQFVALFRLGRQAPEAGGPCTGGTGQPA